MKIENGVLLEVTNNDIKNGTFTIPHGITSIGKCAFYCCESLQSVMIPESVTSIGDGAFYCCKNLQSITIPDNVTSIGDYAFRYCKNLQNITIPDSVTSIGYYAFAYCKSLKNITIPDSVTSIGDGAFYCCTSLQDITIPDSVTSIGYYAFTYCKNLQSEEKIYKAFKPNLTCRNYQYEIGKWSNEIEDIMVCDRGYHYCTNLFDIFNYYWGEYEKDYIICECEIGNKVSENYGDSKCCTNKIKPIRKLERSEVLNILNGVNDK